MESSRHYPPQMSRRSFLGTTTLSVLAISTSPLLSACSASSDSPAESGEAVALPDFVPAGRIKPDLPGNDQGVQDGYLSPVQDYFTSVEGTPSNGGDIRAFLISYGPPPRPPEQNKWWSAINERLGANIKLEQAPVGDFPAKFGSVMAGNDIPDLVQLPRTMTLPRLPDLLRNRFADLSDHLSGGSVGEYPNLAGIPTYAWRNARINGRLYSVPLSRPVFAAPMFYRQDLLEKLGGEPPNSAEEFEALCKSTTDARGGRWALGANQIGSFNVNYFGQMFGAPMGWRREGDTLIKDYETPEFAEAVAFARKLNDAGYFHPDSASTNINELKQLFGSGKVLMYADGLGGWANRYQEFGDSVPGFSVNAFVPFAHDGGKAIQHLESGFFSLTAIKKGDEDRVKELLRVLNFFAAPYGSKESLLTSFGVEGVDWKRNPEGFPVQTKQGKLEQAGWDFIMEGAPILASSEYPNWVRQQYAWEQKAAPLGVGDPTTGIYSEKQADVGAQLTRGMQDKLNNIISGRSPVSEFQNAVRDWKSGGGDTIRQELQEALANNG